MAHAITDDGVRLWYEEAGEGVPVVFVHEFAGDHRSWEPQLRFSAAGTAASLSPRAGIHPRTCRAP